MSDGRRVAVVIPCYDDGATLPETLASVAAQEPCEVVVVDDGSRDPDTLELLAGLDVAVVRQANAGPAAARMTGVQATSARYVMPLDADDLLARDALRLLADALDANADAAAAWGDSEVFGPGWTRPAPVRVRTIDPWLVTYLNPYRIGSLMRRDPLLEAGGWQLREGYEDWDLWMALAERGHSGVHVGALTFRYRVHGRRRWHGEVGRHEEFVANLRARHPRLYAERARNRPRSRAPRRVKLLLPLTERVPLVGSRWRARLTMLVWEPRRLAAAAAHRAAARIYRFR